MGRKEEILEKVRALAAPLAAQEGMELVDVEFGGAGGRTTLRLFIDKAGGGSLEGCSSLSRGPSPPLHGEDPPQGPFDFEVSRPGLGPPLRTPQDFGEIAGQKVPGQTF